MIRRIRYSSHDWAANTVGIRAMLDDDYEPEPITPEEPWISVFCTELSNYDPEASPLLFRIVAEASKPVVPIPADPFVYLSNEDPTMHIQGAFSEFAPLCASNNNNQQAALYPSHHHDHKMAAHLKKINHSFSNMKLNLRKPRSHDSAFSSEETVRGDDDLVHKLLRILQLQLHQAMMMASIIINNSHHSNKSMLGAWYEK